MEDVLDVYTRPYDPARPLVCLDETSKQLTKGIRPVKARFQAFSGCQFHGMSSSMRFIL